MENATDVFDLLNEYAAEHLIIASDNAAALSEKVVNAGSIFLGHYSPESVGDYASGTNHTLPTNGYAKAYSGVSLDSFVKKITLQQLSKEGLKNIQSLWFVLAFTSIGLETKFSDLLGSENRKPLYAFLLAQLFNIIITLIIAYLLFR